MYKILENKYIGEDMYFMKVEGNFKAEMGQFYMLRAWDIPMNTWKETEIIHLSY